MVACHTLIGLKLNFVQVLDAHIKHKFVSEDYSETPIVKDSFDHQPSICNVEFEYLTNIELEAMNSKEKLKLYLKVFIVLFEKNFIFNVNLSNIL